MLVLWCFQKYINRKKSKQKEPQGVWGQAILLLKVEAETQEKAHMSKFVI